MKSNESKTTRKAPKPRAKRTASKARPSGPTENELIEALSHLPIDQRKSILLKFDKAGASHGQMLNHSEIESIAQSLAIVSVVAAADNSNKEPDFFDTIWDGIYIAANSVMDFVKSISVTADVTTSGVKVMIKKPRSGKDGIDIDTEFTVPWDVLIRVARAAVFRR